LISCQTKKLLTFFAPFSRTIMQAFHNDPAIKAALVAQLEAHYAADEIIKGTYWKKGKGCAVGCCVHSDDHGLLETRYGIPKQIAHLMDEIFERLPNEQAKDFPLAVIKAIPVGADLSKVINYFLEWILIDPKHGVARFNSDPSILVVADLHRRIIEGRVVHPKDWAAAKAAAAAAGLAAGWAAARAAGAAAAAAAGLAAARAAAADTDADWAAARAAAAFAQSKKLIELLAAAKI
jgi:hypothetical protein